MVKGIEIKVKGKTNGGYCVKCKRYFRKGEVIIRTQIGVINKIKYSKMCLNCVLQPIAEKVGWEKIIEGINKEIVDAI